MEYRVYDSTLFVCGGVCVCMCPCVHLPTFTWEGEKLRMRSKANNFIGGLHNSAAIPGVIVFPLRLSCRDESLMHSCLGIMDGTSQLLPCLAAGAGSWGEMNRGEGGDCMEDMYGVWNEQSNGWAEEKA